MAHTIIGMAGHIDHGKTSLIKALTGIETDQLKEEKKRGITIDLGFAYWQDHITIIDVPGHERFIHNMVSGVHTVDFFILVIAADDGVMPQTAEHLSILNFFGIQQGLVVINKADLVEADWLRLVRSDIEDFLDRRGFLDLPIFEVSAITGQGIEPLRDFLLDMSRKVRRKREDRPFRLNIDRSFLVGGIGLVVTGTILSGKVNVGQEVELLPVKKNLKVKSLQLHRHSVESAGSGDRIAINLSGAQKIDVSRGMVLTEFNSLEPGKTLLARIQIMPETPFKLKQHRRVWVHLGTTVGQAKLTAFENIDFFEPGKTYFCRLYFAEQITAAPGDPLIIRTISPVHTFGGGHVLEIHPPLIRRNKDNWPKDLEILNSGDIALIILRRVENQGFRFCTADDIGRWLFYSVSQIEPILSALEKKKRIILETKDNSVVVAAVSRLEELIGRIEMFCQNYLQKTPGAPGVRSNQIQAGLKTVELSEKFLLRALNRAVAAGKLQKQDELYLPAGTDRSSWDDLPLRISRIYQQARFSPPDSVEVSRLLNLPEKEIKRVSAEMVRNKKLLSVNGQFYLSTEIFPELLNFLNQHFTEHELLAITHIKDFTGASRKYLIPIMEFLDKSGYTTRVGEDRKKGLREFTVT